MTRKRAIPDAGPTVGCHRQWKQDGVVAEIDLKLVQAAILTGGASALPGEKEIQEGDENTSTDEQETRALDRFRPFIADIFCHALHGVQ
ncbi:MAG TPA: hypothetical protein VIW48_04340 [Nitrospiraceae bacterium]